MADKIKLRFKSYTLQLKHAFGLSSGTRTTTPVVLTELEWQGTVGYGEASMPPYLGETHQSVINFLSGLDMSQFTDPFKTQDILDYVNGKMPFNMAAKASVDIALHDLVGKLSSMPLYKMWGYNAAKAPYTSYTIGIDDDETTAIKIKEAKNFKILKIKLGSGKDEEIIKTVRKQTNVPICVDVNQGWTDKFYAYDIVNMLAQNNVLFVEQPMPKTMLDETAWLTQHSQLPIIADESVQCSNDIIKVAGAFSGINIKLMKSGGLREARRMIDIANAMDMKTMLGCMTETSCAISAAAQLSPAVHWADLDGAALISNDIFIGMQIIDGKITLNNNFGIGVKPVVFNL